MLTHAYHKIIYQAISYVALYLIALQNHVQSKMEVKLKWQGMILRVYQWLAPVA